MPPLNPEEVTAKLAELDARLKATEADCKAAHGIIDKATEMLRSYPWLSTVGPALVAAFGGWYANSHMGPTTPAFDPAPLIKKIEDLHKTPPPK